MSVLIKLPGHFYLKAGNAGVGGAAGAVSRPPQQEEQKPFSEDEWKRGYNDYSEGDSGFVADAELFMSSRALVDQLLNEDGVDHTDVESWRIRKRRTHATDPIDQASAIMDYSHGFDGHINFYLRGAVDALREKLKSEHSFDYDEGRFTAGIERAKQLIPVLDRVLSRFDLPRNTIMHRGVTKNALPEFARDDPSKLVGTTFWEDGYASSSLSEDIAKSFIGMGDGPSKSVLMHIRTPAGKLKRGGAYIKAASYYPHENEFLYGRQTHFRVDHVSTGTDGYTHMYCTVTE